MGTDDWLEFCDLATIGAGKIPADIISDKELFASVPVFFRSIRKEGIDKKKIQDKIDSLLGGETEYEIYHYGFKE